MDRGQVPISSPAGKAGPAQAGSLRAAPHWVHPTCWARFARLQACCPARPQSWACAARFSAATQPASSGVHGCLRPCEALWASAPRCCTAAGDSRLQARSCLRVCSWLPVCSVRPCSIRVTCPSHAQGRALLSSDTFCRAVRIWRRHSAVALAGKMTTAASSDRITPKQMPASPPSQSQGLW